MCYERSGAVGTDNERNSSEKMGNSRGNCTMGIFSHGDQYLLHRAMHSCGWRRIDQLQFHLEGLISACPINDKITKALVVIYCHKCFLLHSLSAFANKRRRFNKIVERNSQYVYNKNADNPQNNGKLYIVSTRCAKVLKRAKRLTAF